MTVIHSLALLPARLPLDVIEEPADSGSSSDSKTWLVVGIVAVVVIAAGAVALVLRKKRAASADTPTA